MKLLVLFALTFALSAQTKAPAPAPVKPATAAVSPAPARNVPAPPKFATPANSAVPVLTFVPFAPGQLAAATKAEADLQAADKALSIANAEISAVAGNHISVCTAGVRTVVVNRIDMAKGGIESRTQKLPCPTPQPTPAGSPIPAAPARPVGAVPNPNPAAATVPAAVPGK